MTSCTQPMELTPQENKELTEEIEAEKREHEEREAKLRMEVKKEDGKKKVIKIVITESRSSLVFAGVCLCFLGGFVIGVTADSFSEFIRTILACLIACLGSVIIFQN